ncbi:MAG: ABC transporter ATP-binding protein [Armatimonadota bacterium]
MIEAESLRKTFQDRKRGSVAAVDGISFHAAPGEVLGILGVNGAGKTTLLRVLATLLQPTGGSARVAGFDIRRQPVEVRRRLGFLSSTTALYGRLTAREMLAYFGGLQGIRGVELTRRADRLIELLQLHDFADRLCDRLSTGQKQRVSLARTLIHDPPVLILDEPTAGLDVVASHAIVEYVGDCRQQGKTILFSSHVMSEVERLCDRALVVHQGRVVAEGTVEELRRQSGDRGLEAAFLHLIGGAA